MKASQETIKKGNELLCSIDVFRTGNFDVFNGGVLRIDADGVELIYLQGIHSRTDFIAWQNIHAKVDKRKPVISIHGFKGRFQPFDNELSRIDVIGQNGNDGLHYEE